VTSYTSERTLSVRTDIRKRTAFSLLDMGFATATRLMVASVGLHHAGFPVPVGWPYPVGESVEVTVLIPPFRCPVHIPLDPEKLFAAAAEGRVRLKDLSGLVLEEYSVAGTVF